MWVRKHGISQGEVVNRIPKFRKLLECITVALETGWELYLPDGDWITLHKGNETLVIDKDNLMRYSFRELYNEGYYITSGAVIFLVKGNKTLGFDYIFKVVLTNPDSGVVYQFPLESVGTKDNKLSLEGIYTKIYKTMLNKEDLTCRYRIWWTGDK